MDKAHAVRWARGKPKHFGALDYTKWHATIDSSFTLCGLAIPLGLEGTFLPETDDNLVVVNCMRCGDSRYWANGFTDVEYEAKKNKAEMLVYYCEECDFDWVDDECPFCGTELSVASQESDKKSD